MSDNKILDLSFEFAVEVVTIADSIKVPKSTYMLDRIKSTHRRANALLSFSLQTAESVVYCFHQEKRSLSPCSPSVNA